MSSSKIVSVPTPYPNSDCVYYVLEGRADIDFNGILYTMIKGDALYQTKANNVVLHTSSKDFQMLEYLP